MGDRSAKGVPSFPPFTTSFSIPFLFLPLIKYCAVVLMRITGMSRSITNRKKLQPPASTFSY